MKSIHAGTLHLKAGNIKVAYEEANPERVCTVFFIHGNSGSRHIWIKQLREPLFTEFRLVALDLPGHGDSAVPEPASEYYSVLGMAKIITKAISTLAGGKPYILVGISLGTNIACECLPQLQAKGIVLISPCIVGAECPLSVIFKRGTNISAFFSDDAAPATVEQTLKRCLQSRSGGMFNNILIDYQRVSSNFRSQFHQSVIDQQYNDEIKLLKESGLSPLLIFGKSDHIINIDYLDQLQVNNYHGKIFKLSSARHFVHIDQSVLVNSLLLQYFTDIFLLEDNPCISPEKDKIQE